MPVPRNITQPLLQQIRKREAGLSVLLLTQAPRSIRFAARSPNHRAACRLANSSGNNTPAAQSGANHAAIRQNAPQSVGCQNRSCPDVLLEMKAFAIHALLPIKSSKGIAEKLACIALGHTTARSCCRSTLTFRSLNRQLLMRLRTKVSWFRNQRRNGVDTAIPAPFRSAGQSRVAIRYSG